MALARVNTIGWVGLGAMGHPMALNLFSKTFSAHQQSSGASKEQAPTFLICEQDNARADAFVAEAKERAGSDFAQRIERVGTGKEMAGAAGRIVTMLPSTPQVEAVYLDPKAGILPGLLSLPADTPSLPSPTSGSSGLHTLLIDQTTLDPTAAVSIAKRISEETKGKAVMMDAPVSGGIVAAKAGSLTIMFGSPSETATAMAVPLLERMAREGGVVPCGANGTGVGVKVCNNLILAINQIGLAEGLALGKALGIDPMLLHNVINTSSGMFPASQQLIAGQSWSSRVNSPLAEVSNSPGSRNYAGGFQSRLMLKDVGLALKAAHTHDLPMPLSWAADSVYQSVCTDRDGELATKDFSSVLEWLKRKKEEGVEVGWKETAKA